MSISTEITRLNTNINNLKQTKQDIKNAVNNDFTEITNEQIESYAQKIKDTFELYKDQIPFTETEQATEIAVNDAMVYSKNKLELFGNTYQAQYTGKNLYNDNAEITDQYINNNGNWKTGTDSDTFIQILIENNIAESYIASYTEKVGTSYIRYSYFNGDTFIKRDLISTNNTPVTVPEGTTKIYIHTDKRSTKYFVNLQIEAGSIATNYEHYVGGVPSPNPNYPQQIHVVKGNNIIKVDGKNLFNKNTTTKTLISIDGKESSNNYWTSSDYISINQNLNYTFSWIPINPSINYWQGRVLYYNDNKQFISGLNLSAYPGTNKYYQLITNIPNNTQYIRLSFTDSVGGTYERKNIQLEIGSTATLYKPYYHQDYPLNLGSLELCKIGNYQDYIYKENGNWYKYGAIRKYTQTNAVNFSLRRVRLVSSSDLHDMGTSENPVNLSTSIKVNISTSNNSRYNYGWGGLGFVFSQEEMDMIDVEDATAFKNYLDENLVAYVVIKPECDYIDITQITDETLIAQLEAIYNHLALVKGTNHITITPNDLAPYMKLNYKKLETNENSL